MNEDSREVSYEYRNAFGDNALSYYHDHQDEIEQEMIENTEEYGRAYLREHLGEEMDHG